MNRTRAAGGDDVKRVETPGANRPLTPPAPAGPRRRDSVATRVATLAAVVLPFFGLVAAVAGCWGWGIRWIDLGLLLGMYALTTVGITVGFHRLFTHRSFETSRPVQFVLAVLGSMAVQGPLLTWVGIHRRHHQHSDTPDDPHTPAHHGGGFAGLVRGWWYAHLGWMLTPDQPDASGYVKDLRRSRLLRAVSAAFPVWAALGLLLPAAVGGLVSGTWAGALLGLVWGGLARVCLVHHVTWSINSVCHLWGGRPHPTPDRSRNNFILGVLALGEGWHNNHHAFPTSARHGLRWWQPDVSYWVIRLMALCRLARKVRLPATRSACGSPDRPDTRPSPNGAS
jgi:stearoyl-CoA desaturase (delta-9 desaturase)